MSALLRPGLYKGVLPWQPVWVPYWGRVYTRVSYLGSLYECLVEAGFIQGCPTLAACMSALLRPGLYKGVLPWQPVWVPCWGRVYTRVSYLGSLYECLVEAGFIQGCPTLAACMSALLRPGLYKGVLPWQPVWVPYWGRVYTRVSYLGSLYECLMEAGFIQGCPTLAACMSALLRPGLYKGVLPWQPVWVPYWGRVYTRVSYLGSLYECLMEAGFIQGCPTLAACMRALLKPGLYKGVLPWQPVWVPYWGRVYTRVSYLGSLYECLIETGFIQGCPTLAACMSALLRPGLYKGVLPWQPVWVPYGGRVYTRVSYLGSLYEGLIEAGFIQGCPTLAACMSALLRPGLYKGVLPWQPVWVPCWGRVYTRVSYLGSLYKCLVEAGFIQGCPTLAACMSALLRPGLYKGVLPWQPVWVPYWGRVYTRVSYLGSLYECLIEAGFIQGCPTLAACMSALLRPGLYKGVLPWQPVWVPYGGRVYTRVSYLGSLYECLIEAGFIQGCPTLAACMSALLRPGLYKGVLPWQPVWVPCWGRVYTRVSYLGSLYECLVEAGFIQGCPTLAACMSALLRPGLYKGVLPWQPVWVPYWGRVYTRVSYLGSLYECLVEARFIQGCPTLAACMSALLRPGLYKGVLPWQPVWVPYWGRVYTRVSYLGSLYECLIEAGFIQGCPTLAACMSALWRPGLYKGVLPWQPVWVPYWGRVYTRVSYLGSLYECLIEAGFIQGCPTLAACMSALLRPGLYKGVLPWQPVWVPYWGRVYTRVSYLGSLYECLVEAGFIQGCPTLAACMSALLRPGLYKGVHCSTCFNSSTTSRGTVLETLKYKSDVKCWKTPQTPRSAYGTK